MLTSDPKDPKLKEGQKNETGQHEIYLVLSDEERVKEFVRPVRTAYIHVGRNIKSYYKGIHRMLTDEEREEREEYPDKKYVAVMISLVDENGKFIGGSYVNQETLDAWKEGKYIGGCGVETTMNITISETFASNPNFYGATYCTGCRKHLPVGEFKWSIDNQIVGS